MNWEKQIIPKITIWIPPDSGWVKCNFDGCSIGNSGEARARGVVRDESDIYVVRYNKGLETTMNNFSEAYVVWVGIGYLRDNGYKKVIVEGDSNSLLIILTTMLKHPRK